MLFRQPSENGSSKTRAGDRKEFIKTQADIENYKFSDGEAANVLHIEDERITD